MGATVGDLIEFCNELIERNNWHLVAEPVSLISESVRIRRRGPGCPGFDPKTDVIGVYKLDDFEDGKISEGTISRDYEVWLSRSR
jgi:hypothetical protein